MNLSGQHGISEHHRAYFTAYDHVQKKWHPNRSCSASEPSGRDLRKEARALRDRLGAKTKTGGLPKISYLSHWIVSICNRSPDGGRKTFVFDSNDAVDRQRAFREAIVYRDMLQVRCNSTNGDPATQT